MVEPWLSGAIADVHPALASVLYSFEQIKQEARQWTEGLTSDQIWAGPHGVAPVGFHLRHIAGSVGRLMRYVEGLPLTDDQLAALGEERTPGQPRQELLAELETALERAAGRIRSLDPASLQEPRLVGRRQLPATVIGLLIHIAEHSQRHLGAAIVTSKMVRAL
jgi:hypothetical protein